MAERTSQKTLPLVAVGVGLALMVYVVSYDNGGREGACNDAAAELRRSHPDAVEFRNARGGLTHSCDALDASGAVLGRVTYPGTAHWVLVAVMLAAPLTVAAGLRRFRTHRRRS